MEEFKKFSLYDEEEPISKTETSESTSTGIDLEIDLSSGTLYALINPIREFLKDKPEDRLLTVYLVCGNTCSSDVCLFVDFLKTVTNPLRIVFRGIIHMDFIKLFLTYPNIYVDSTCKMIYVKNKLHNFISDLLINPNILRAFLQRFVETYHNLSDESTLDISELNLIGIQIEKF